MTTLRSGAATHTGQIRANNQDAILVAEPVFAVADGMGGHAAGEVASEVAVASLQASDVSSLEALREAVRQANRSVWERAGDDEELRGMGTTLCAVALIHPGPDGGSDQDDRIIVANVGDSRVYQFHDDDLTQITDDHSLVEDLVREGRLTAEEARTHPQRNILTRVLGNEAEVDVDGWELLPHRGDRFVLCSDGLFNEVDEGRIASVLRRLADPDDAAQELVTLANQHGGRDNVSVVVVDIVDDGDRAGRASATAAVAAVPGASASGAMSTGSETASPSSASWTSQSQPLPSPATRHDSEPKGRRRGILTWRSVVFVASVLVVLGGSTAAVAWFARGTYHVGLDDEQVVIFRGRPGGLLWIEPTLAERSSLSLSDVPESRLGAVTAGKEEPSLVAARRYIAALEQQAEAERPTTTTTTVTSTTTTMVVPGPTGTGTG